MARIADAIAAAELRTTGEIRVVVATRPLMNLHVYPLLWGALAALLLPWIAALFFPLHDLALFGLQLALFVALTLLLSLPALSRRVTPLRAREHAAREAALSHFLSLGIHETQDRTGILILVALADHVAEVVADPKIHAHVGCAAWHAVCEHVIDGARGGRLADGIMDGVAEAGRVLATHFPPRADNANELPDHVVVV